MKHEIRANIDDPKQLERLYRDNKAVFKRDFNALYPELKGRPVAEVWNERLNYESSDISWGTHNELRFVIVASLLAGIIAKIPAFLPIGKDFFYFRNTGFVVFPLLTAYFVWKNTLQPNKVAIIAGATLMALVFINLLPVNSQSDTLQLACIHLPLFLWAILGFSFVGHKLFDNEKRLDFLRYNGDLVVMTALILIAGAVLTAVTFTLFSVIGLNINRFYGNYVVVFGLAASPIVGTYVIRSNPQLVNKVSPVIAKIFSPLVLVTLVVYLIAIIYSRKDPYNDREFLLIFNILLLGVMAIILFSIAETSRTAKNQTGTRILFLLAVVTIIVNGIALSAIGFRIVTWGITPNRLAVLGGNVLILINLVIVTIRLFNVLKNKGELQEVERSIAAFLPIYTLWTFVVVFVFPFLFWFK
ncbi:hypothetical protein [Runella sp.]|uniref:hypothetical protein n=1 Tax=Runella sp. TaxID=1960881 RepID=UPI003D0D06F8